MSEVKGNKGRTPLGREMLGLVFHYLKPQLRTVQLMIREVTLTGSWLQGGKGKLSKQFP